MFTRSWNFINRTFEAGELALAFEGLCGMLNSKETPKISVDIDLNETLADGTSRERRGIEASESQSVCDLSRTALTAYFAQRDDEMSAVALVLLILIRWQFLSEGNGCLSFNFSSDSIHTINGAKAYLAETLRLKEVDLEVMAKRLDRQSERLNQKSEKTHEQVEVLKALLGNLKERIEKLEDRAQAIERSQSAGTLHCFLSYRFSDDHNTISELRQYLEEVHSVKILDGVAFEPRPVSTKIRERLQYESYDFAILLVRRDGESAWTRDEIGALSSRGIPLFLVVEKGAQFDPGIFGDLEVIYFDKGHVSSAFIKIAQGIRYVLSNR